METSKLIEEAKSLYRHYNKQPGRTMKQDEFVVNFLMKKWECRSFFNAMIGV